MRGSPPPPQQPHLSSSSSSSPPNGESYEEQSMDLSLNRNPFYFRLSFLVDFSPRWTEKSWKIVAFFDFIRGGKTLVINLLQLSLVVTFVSCLVSDIMLFVFSSSRYAVHGIRKSPSDRRSSSRDWWKYC